MLNKSDRLSDERMNQVCLKLLHTQPLNTTHCTNSPRSSNCATLNSSTPNPQPALRLIPKPPITKPSTLNQLSTLVVSLNPAASIVACEFGKVPLDTVPPHPNPNPSTFHVPVHAGA